MNFKISPFCKRQWEKTARWNYANHYCDSYCKVFFRFNLKSPSNALDGFTKMKRYPKWKFIDHIFINHIINQINFYLNKNSGCVKQNSCSLKFLGPQGDCYLCFYENYKKTNNKILRIYRCPGYNETLFSKLKLFRKKVNKKCLSIVTGEALISYETKQL